MSLCFSCWREGVLPSGLALSTLAADAFCSLFLSVPPPPGNLVFSTSLLLSRFHLTSLFLFQTVIVGSYLIAHGFFSVYGMCVDTLFLCFCKCPPAGQQNLPPPQSHLDPGVCSPGLSVGFSPTLSFPTFHLPSYQPLLSPLPGSPQPVSGSLSVSVLWFWGNLTATNFNFPFFSFCFVFLPSSCLSSLFSSSHLRPALPWPLPLFPSPLPIPAASSWGCEKVKIWRGTMDLPRGLTTCPPS